MLNFNAWQCISNVRSLQIAQFCSSLTGSGSSYTSSLWSAFGLVGLPFLCWEQKGKEVAYHMFSFFK